MNLPVTRRVDLFSFFICVLFLAVAAYLQYRVGLIPCPLCLIQRFLITLVGLLFLMGALFDFSAITRCCLHILTSLLAVLGIIIAGRQLWLEHFPAGQLVSCQATFAHYSNSVYFRKLIELFFQGTSNCGSGNWQFLHLSLPMWTLLLFIFLLLIALRQVYINRLAHKRSEFF